MTDLPEIKNAAYKRVTRVMRRCSPVLISDDEAEEAVNNLIIFTKTALEIQSRINKDKRYDA